MPLRWDKRSPAITFGLIALSAQCGKYPVQPNVQTITESTRPSTSSQLPPVPGDFSWPLQPTLTTAPFTVNLTLSDRSLISLIIALQKFPCALSIKILSMTFKSWVTGSMHTSFHTAFLSSLQPHLNKPSFNYSNIPCAQVISRPSRVLIFLPRTLIPPPCPAPLHVPHPFYLTSIHNLGFRLSVTSSGESILMFQTRSGSPLIYTP